MAHFFLIQGWEALAGKRDFRGWLRLGEGCRQRAAAAEFFAETELREAFNIITNYRHKAPAVAEAQRRQSPKRRLLRIIFIMLLAGGALPSESAEKPWRKCLFFAKAGGTSSKCGRGVSKGQELVSKGQGRVSKCQDLISKG